jgi:hypothetical protein
MRQSVMTAVEGSTGRHHVIEGETPLIRVFRRSRVFAVAPPAMHSDVVKT